MERKQRRLDGIGWEGGGEQERQDRDKHCVSCDGRIGQKLFCLVFVSGLAR